MSAIIVWYVSLNNQNQFVTCIWSYNKNIINREGISRQTDFQSIVSIHLICKMILLAILIATFIGYYYWKRRRLIYLASKLKGLNGYPVIGSALKFLDTESK